MECRTCELVARRDRDEAPPWDRIYRTRSWDVVHCYGTSVEGWLVLISRVHRSAIADLTDAESQELGPLLTIASRALHGALGSVKTYAVQFAEHPMHPHVHFYVIPRRADHPDGLKGPRVFQRLGVPDDEAVPEDRMNEIAADVADYFEQAAVLAPNSR